MGWEQKRFLARIPTKAGNSSRKTRLGSGGAYDWCRLSFEESHDRANIWTAWNKLLIMNKPPCDMSKGDGQQRVLVPRPTSP